jgi:hypothetical protein
MKVTPVFTGRIDRGKLILDTPQRYLVHLVCLDGKPIELIVRKRKSQRSLQQNAYYWGVVIEILANHFGYEAGEMHEALKFKFLRTHEGDLPAARSTAKLNTEEFVAYVDRVVRWAAQEHQLYIPDPGQVEYATQASA